MLTKNSKKMIQIGGNDTNPQPKSVNDTNLKDIKKGESSQGLLNKNQKKGKCEAMIYDTNDTNDTSDTDECIKSIICITYHDVVQRLGKSPKIKVFGLLLDGNKRTYDEIGKETEQKPGYVRVLMNRMKDHFEEVDTINGKKTFKLSPLGLQQIQNKLQNYENTQKSAINDTKKRIKQRDELKKLKEDISKSLDDMNPKIEGKIITIDFKELLLYNQELADKLLDNPLEAIDEIKIHYDELGVTDVRFINLPNTQKRTAEGIRCKDIDRLLTIEGRCVSLSSPRPVVINAKFECPSCGTIISVLQIE